MRRTERIPEILEEFKRIWHSMPDVRFNQLVDNLQHEYKIAVGKGNLDFFYLEDEDFLTFLKEYRRQEGY